MSDGFERIPRRLIRDAAMTLQARAVFVALRDALWAQTGTPGETISGQLPPLQELAERLGCSVTALKGYLRELKQAGWVATSRASRGKPQLYTLFWDPREAESDSRVGRNPTHSRARDRGRDLEEREGEDEAKASPSLARPRNIVFDAVAEETLANPDISGGEIGKAAAAIRAAEADEISARSERFLAENPSYDAVPPHSIDLWLAGRVRERAERYRQCRPEWELTPSALAKHWLRIPTWEPRDLSPGDIARMDLGA